MLYVYANPEATGWLGWFDDANGKALAYVTLEGTIVPAPERSCAELE